MGTKVHVPSSHKKTSLLTLTLNAYSLFLPSEEENRETNEQKKESSCIPPYVGVVALTRSQNATPAAHSTLLQTENDAGEESLSFPTPPNPGHQWKQEGGHHPVEALGVFLLLSTEGCQIKALLIQQGSSSKHQAEAERQGRCPDRGRSLG